MWRALERKIAGYAGSPSASSMIWVMAFLAGLGTAALAAPRLRWALAGPPFLGLALSAAVCGFAVKARKARLFLLAGLFFGAGVMRFIAASDNDFDPLSLFPFLVRLKFWLVAAVGKMLPEPYAGLVAGLLVGGGVRSADLRAAFIATGTIHVMALSGWNINIIERWLDWLLRFFRFRNGPRRAAVVLAVAAYVIMAGAASSLVRAALMAAAVYVAELGGRPRAPGRALAYAAALILLATPRALVADVGFLLSVAATAGMVYLLPIVRSLAGRLPKMLNLSETAAATIAATLATLPVILPVFGRTSFVALPANILLLPLIAPTMLVGLVGAIVSSAFPPLAGICGWAVRLFAVYDVSVIRLFARLPGASFSGIALNRLAALLMAVGLVAIAVYGSHRPKKV